MRCQKHHKYNTHAGYAKAGFRKLGPGLLLHAVNYLYKICLLKFDRNFHAWNLTEKVYFPSRALQCVPVQATVHCTDHYSRVRQHSALSAVSWRSDFVVPRTLSSLTYGDRTFAAARPRLWISLPVQLRNPGITYGLFRRQLKRHLFREAWTRRVLCGECKVMWWCVPKRVVKIEDTNLTSQTLTQNIHDARPATLSKFAANSWLIIGRRTAAVASVAAAENVAVYTRLQLGNYKL